MIEHTQAPSTAINLTGVIVDFTDGDVTVSGTAVVQGIAHSLSDTYLDVAAGWTLYVAADGSLTEDGSLAFAHLCWFDGTDLHVIKHA